MSAKKPPRPGLGSALLQAAGLPPVAPPDFAEMRAKLAEEAARRGALPQLFQDLALRDAEARDIEAARRAMESTPDSPLLRLRYADVLRGSGRPEEAVAVYRQCLDAPETREVALFCLASLGAEPMPDKVPPGLVAGIFDGHAKTFETDLVDTLKYQGPALLDEAVRAVRRFAPRSADVCDAGCGTGLCGEMFRPVARTLTGVDVSAEMLRRAEGKGLYDRLVHDDAAAMLAREPRAFDLVVAGDMINYLGDLAALMSAAAGALRPGGLFALTTETLEDGGGFRLMPSGRYRHADDYVALTASGSGLSIARRAPATLRFELGQPVASTVVVLGKPGRSQ